MDMSCRRRIARWALETRAISGRFHQWLPRPPELAMKDRFAARYRGWRCSFGCPACLDLDEQTGPFRMLEPAAIGIELTEGMVMAPEASASALVFHHPGAHVPRLRAGSSSPTRTR